MGANNCNMLNATLYGGRSSRVQGPHNNGFCHTFLIFVTLSNIMLLTRASVVDTSFRFNKYQAQGNCATKIDRPNNDKNNSVTHKNGTINTTTQANSGGANDNIRASISNSTLRNNGTNNRTVNSYDNNINTSSSSSNKNDTAVYNNNNNNPNKNGNASTSSGGCRCALPGSDCWPSMAAWNALNTSLGGQLVKPSPPASPCYGPNLNVTACQIAANNWINPFWRADQVGAMQYANREAHGNESCSLLPPSTLAALTANQTTMASLRCEQGAIPSYAVEAQHPSHVQTAVKFAAQQNIRLTVKSTGHDNLGRSTGPDSLNLWVHKLKNITFYNSFTPAGCDGNRSVSAVTVESGAQWEDLYKAADERNVVVVGAMSSSVSVGGGYLQGGGHSPLSPFLGLAADNVIEIKVVTADGRLVTANACQNQDLFWALRGGGGGTFGVVVSSTHITFPALNNIVNVFMTVKCSNSTLFEELLTEFIYLQSLLSLSNHWAGYSYIYCLNPSSFSLILNFLVPNCNNTSIAKSSFENLTAFIDQHHEEIIANVSFYTFPSFRAWHSTVLCSANPGICSDPSGANAALASRLLPAQVLQDHAPQVAKSFMEMLSSGIGQIVGHLVGGQAVSVGADPASHARLVSERLAQANQRPAQHMDDNGDASNYNKKLLTFSHSSTLPTSARAAKLPSAAVAQSMAHSSSEEQLSLAPSSVNPAWRKSLWHVVLISTWDDHANESQRAEKLRNLTEKNGLLRDLSPGSGCYLNEADVNEPNWQQAFFGDNYSRLKRIKEDVDPQGLFTCTNCVGSEDWAAASQTDHLICRQNSLKSSIL